MQHFPINWQLEFDSEVLRELRLNHEWTITGLAIRYGHFQIPLLNSINIRRTDTSGDFSISGELTIYHGDALIRNAYISQLISEGNGATEIVSNIFPDNQICSYNYRILGIVIITENEKCPAGSENGESKDKLQIQSLEQLSKDFKLLLEPNRSCFSDVILTCGDANIPAHKNILSARSPVFASMFAHPMKENIEGKVNVTDIDVSILQALLTYMYTGKVSDLTVDSATDLLFAADKYQIQDLKSVCSHFLEDNVTFQNVLKILVFGDMHAEDLKVFALEYICNNCAEFSVLEKTEEWKTLQKEKPALAMDVLLSFIKSKEEKSKS